MRTFKDRLIAKEIDKLIIPCQLTDKTLCKCPDPCLVRLLLEFALRLNQVKNQSNCPSSSSGLTTNSVGDTNFGPTRIKWKTQYSVATGKKIILTQHEMRVLYDYINSPKSKFGLILREIIKQEQEKKMARNPYTPFGTNDSFFYSSNQGNRQFCVKVCHNNKRRVKTCSPNNCCHYAKKNCRPCSKKGKCVSTNCY